MLSVKAASLWLAVVLLFAWVATWWIYRVALSKNILDIPNHRSSHQHPVPRGGGISFVLAFLISLPLANLSLVLSFTFIAAGVTLAVLGFCDDLVSIKSGYRICIHFAVASLVLFGLQGMPPIAMFSGLITSPWLLNAFALLYLVWLLNLYNFMDGIDGIASVQAITVCLGAALVYVLSNDYALLPLPLLLAAAVGGFLFWNFPPAKIFMGDVGSGFLGVFIGIFSIQAGALKPALFWSWLILMGVFIVDATITVTRRFLRGERVYQAHRLHAYQQATDCYDNHRTITLAVGLINMIWLWPWAILVGLGKISGGLGCLLAYFPLFLLANKYNAGKA